MAQPFLPTVIQQCKFVLFSNDRLFDCNVSERSRCCVTIPTVTGVTPLLEIKLDSDCKDNVENNQVCFKRKSKITWFENKYVTSRVLSRQTNKSVALGRAVVYLNHLVGFSEFRKSETPLKHEIGFF